MRTAKRFIVTRGNWMIVLTVLVGLLFPAQGWAATTVTSQAPALAPLGPGASANFYKFDVSNDGLYKVTYADLLAAGIPANVLDTLDPATFQMFEQGAELAIHVVDQGDGHFNPNDFILFYGRKIDTQYSGANVYWLTFGAQAGLRMSARSVAPAGATARSSFPNTLHLEQNLLYKGEIPKEGVADRWYWRSFDSQLCDPIYCQVVVATLTYNPTLPSLGTGTAKAELRAMLRGSSSEFAINPDHHALFFVNGHVVGEGSWDSTGVLVADNDLPVAGAGPYDWEGNADPNGNCVLTTAGGNYSFSGLDAGQYVVDVAPINFYGGVLTDWKATSRNVGQPTPVNQANDTGTDSDGSVATKDAGVTLADGQAFMTLDFGFTSPVVGAVPGSAQTTPFTPDGTAAVGDRVWYDANKDGLQNVGELGIENALVCLYQDNGNGYYNGPVTFSPNYLIQGSNTVSVTFPIDSGAQWDTGYANWIELDYAAGFAANQDELAFRVPAGGPWSATITGFTSNTVWLADITSPTAPKLLTGGSLASGPGSTYVLGLQDGGAAEVKYWAAGASALRTPANIRADAPSDLLSSTNQADWVAVSHAAFLVRPATANIGGNTVACPPFPQEQDTTYVECLSPPEQLARHRQTYSGMTTMVVDAQDVYDQFNGGVVHPEALHQFALYMRDHWADPAPGYLLLIGDGHYDPRNFLGNSPPVYIPPYLAPIDLIIGEVAAMNRIVSEWSSLDGEPAVPFMGLGLLPANSLAEAQIMVNKTISYETTPVLDGWNMNVTFVGDDKDIAGDFPAHLNEVADDPALLPTDYSANKIYFKVTHPTVNGTTTAILDAINNGTLFVSYAGHASRPAWAGERLLEVPDIPNMTNADRLTIFMPMTCLEGNYIVPNFAAFAESVVRKDGGGGVASWSATGRGVSTGHQEILEGFYEAVFGEGMERLGDITTYAKQRLADSDSIFLDLLDTYLIFGDPATAVQTPQTDLGAAMTVDSPSLAAGDPITITITYSNTSTIPAEGVTLDVLLPPQVVNWNWSGAPGVSLIGDALWSLPDLAPGAGGTLVITGTLDPNAPILSLEIVSAIATTTHESHTGNNRASFQYTAGTASISGVAWADSDSDGVIDPDEAREADVTITLEDGNGTVVATRTTDVNGLYSVTGLAAGSYTVRAGDLVGFVHLSPAEVSVTLAVGESATVNFSFINTTGVDVLTFAASRQAGAALITWATANELDLLGYNIHRSVAGNAYGKRINWELIPANGGGAYNYLDSDAGPGASFYWLEAVEPGGSQFIGPVYLPADTGARPFRMYLPSLSHR